MTFPNVFYEIKEFLKVTSTKKYFCQIMRFFTWKKVMSHSQDIELIVFLIILQTPSYTFQHQNWLKFLNYFRPYCADWKIVSRFFKFFINWQCNATHQFLGFVYMRDGTRWKMERDDFYPALFLVVSVHTFERKKQWQVYYNRFLNNCCNLLNKAWI